MSKLKPDVTIVRSGIFTQWDEESNNLPRLLKSTMHVPAEIDIEFGFIAQIKKAKNQKLKYCIYHPDIPDDSGQVRLPFEGEVFVKSNDWKFYLGDTIWAPEHNKVGNWRMTLEIKGKVIAEKTFKVHLNEEEDKIAAFWKHRGF
ncbi:DUF3859 domain-containing protein [Shewanella schlegeliana]|uniref:DUF3859 domain-containing protein n=1 Tax=Shewanella schlegeliana TaxID=190308 RepID=A0ABS1T277_9GAMM|nr:DUF3859 domain-containing protein [Shewanella schlegeliana]MBL4914908.1 DUF3859 domain-containing protein [Shewanella schlegeliana]MCL1110401.1 DUF3859 domain-containing protein [Shewanella schlegeliana]GIU27828.1 hypothetical protein TUM4433_15310 [Shewanella schlegeliana]